MTFLQDNPHLRIKKKICVYTIYLSKIQEHPLKVINILSNIHLHNLIFTLLEICSSFIHQNSTAYLLPKRLDAVCANKLSNHVTSSSSLLKYSNDIMDLVNRLLVINYAS